MPRHVSMTIISLYVLMVCSASASVPRGVNLSNITNWNIIVAQDAPPSEIYAAEEFQNHFARASNIRLPIVSPVSATITGQDHIFIGSSPAMRASQVGFSIDEFGQEGKELSRLPPYQHAVNGVVFA